MKKWFIFSGISLFLAACTSVKHSNQSVFSSSLDKEVIFVGLKSDLSSQSLTDLSNHFQSLGARFVQTLASGKVLVLEASDSVVNKIKDNANVAFVERNQYGYFLPRTTPTKPEFNSNINEVIAPFPNLLPPPWSPKGEYTYGGISIEADKLHAMGIDGSNIAGKSVAVCMIDTGIDARHPEFKGKFKKDMLGRVTNFINLYPDAHNDPFSPERFNSHGTGSAGVIFAQPGNAATRLQPGMNPGGLTGIAPGANIYVVRAMNEDGFSSDWLISQGIDWCTKQLKSEGGQEDRLVISISLGPPPTMTLETAIKDAYSKGALIVAASGNRGTDRIIYPAAYDEVIAVGAIDATGNLTSSSSYGKKQEFVAAGIDYLSTGNLGTSLVAWIDIPNQGRKAITLHLEQIAHWTKHYRSLSNIEVVQPPASEPYLCEPLPPTDRSLVGKAVLIDGAGCDINYMLRNAKAARAVAVLAYPWVIDQLVHYPIVDEAPLLGVISNEDAQEFIDAMPVRTNIIVDRYDYRSYGGTSGAAPHVSGAAALVWSKKPSLTNVELRKLLNSTAQDLGAAGRDDLYGFGLVSPLDAILAP